MMRPAMLKAPTTARTRTAVATSSRACAALLPPASACISARPLTWTPKLQQQLRRGAPAAGQGDAVLSPSDTSTTIASTSSASAGSNTMTAPQPVKPPHQPTTDGSASQPTAKPAPVAEAEAAEHDAAQHFDWNKQWYPIAPLAQLDPSKPAAAQLMGMDLVLWQDRQGQWRAFRDACPHRLAPLSEGRIDGATGNLYCNYHGWQFNSSGACTNIPQQPAGGAPPNPKRGCVASYPTTESEELLWVWADSGPNAEAEAAAAPPRGMAPEANEFGAGGFWSSKLFMEGDNALCSWYQRYCNASYIAVKENVFNDPAHDTVLHHGMGGLSRDKASSAEVQQYSMDGSGYSIARLNASSGRVVSDHTLFPCGVRRNFAGEPRAGAGVGYVVPMSKGKCNMMIAIVRDPKFAMKPKGLKGLLARLLPPTPDWMNHIVLHDVVDADITMQHGLDVNSAHAKGASSAQGYMPAVGVDQGPIAFRTWLRKYGGGGPAMANILDPTGFGATAHLPRRQLLDRYESHTAHCKSCSGALAAFQTLQRVAAQASTVLAAAALGVAAVQACQAASASAFSASAANAADAAASQQLQGASGALVALAAGMGVWAGAASGLGVGVVLLLALAAAAAGRLAGWAERMAARFVFVDYDEHHTSKK
ncbi:hypothetical protein COO60DRAFT_650084 [Scenedesmus sp. NREL 46B-D3]|nr:hypothetical protein COO60DRAFT_650084 [Scenedesmus sp. NREL 46B-D3]